MSFTIILVIIMAAGVLVDQLTKIIVATNMQVGQSIPLIRGVFQFTYVRNRGAAFGMLSEHRWIFMIISTIAIAAICVYLFRFSKDSKLMKVAMAIIASGGIGNMIDRIFLGYVVDMFDFCLIDFWVFNVADSFVCVGAVLLIIGIIIGEKKNESKPK